MGTLIVSIILLLVIALVIRSLIKEKRSGRHPSCGGNCGSCVMPAVNCILILKNFLKNINLRKALRLTVVVT